MRKTIIGKKNIGGLRGKQYKFGIILNVQYAYKYINLLASYFNQLL